MPAWPKAIISAKFCFGFERNPFLAATLRVKDLILDRLKT